MPPGPEGSLASASTGLIVPPSDLKKLVDKTASFVAKGGFGIAERLKKEKEHDPKFTFLFPSTVYHAYFQHMVKEFQEGKLVLNANNQVEASSSNAVSEAPTAEPEEEAGKIPLPTTMFTLDPPPMLVSDLDVIKLTAQFVARNGRSFLTNLMNREQRNYQFEFLKPQHQFFHYFTSLVDQYAKIMLPDTEMKEFLQRSQNAQTVLDQVNMMVRHKKRSEQLKKEMDEANEQERIAMAQIDWNTFCVVQTITFEQNEVGLPPPIRMDELHVRLAEIQRAEKQQRELERLQEGGGEGDDVPPPPPEEQPMEDDMEVEGVPPPPATSSAPATVLDAVLPVSSSSEIKIKAYDPKQAQKEKQKMADYVKSPLTGEMIHVSKIQEHIRIELLNPKWREDSNRQELERIQAMQWNLLGAEHASENLKDLASRRTDLFGYGDVETQIGKKITEKVVTRSDMIWDQGAQASVMVKANLSDPDELLRKKEPEPAPSAGPHIPSHAPLRPSAPPSAPSSAPPLEPPMPTPSILPPPPGLSMSVPAPPGSGPPPPFRPAPPSSGLLPTPPGLGMGGMPPPPHGMPMLPPGLGGPMPPGLGGPMPPGFPHASPQLPPGFGAPSFPPGIQAPFGGLPPGMNVPPPFALPPHESAPSVLEPSGKRQKLDDMLIPEEEFLRSHFGGLKVVVETPVDDKLGLNGQTVYVDMEYSSKIQDLKAKLHDMFNLAPGKQKLFIDELVLNNSNTIAFYNITPATKVQLVTKDRGGRKK